MYSNGAAPRSLSPFSCSLVAHKVSSLSPEKRKEVKTSGEALNLHQVRWVKELLISEKTILDALKAVKDDTK